MNERIFTELYKKAWGHFPCPTGEPELEKFAELIVKECMDIVSDESEKVSDEWRCKDGQHIWWKIKDHFGVK